MTSRQPDLPLRELTAAEVAAFHQDGAVRIAGVLQAEWIERVEEGVHHILANPTILAEATALLGGGGFSGDAFMWKAHDTFRDFMYFSPAARLAQQLFGSQSITAFYDQIFAKPAGNGTPTPFHEDMSSWPVAGEQVCAMWIPLDPCTPDEAALRVVRGSHRWRRQFLPVTPGAQQLSQTGEYEDLPELASTEILSWDLVPGDVVVFHPRALHGATGTGPARGRRAFVSRWLGDDITFQPRHTVLPLLWEHGLSPGDPVGGPLFPRILPRPDDSKSDARWHGPEAPDSDLAEQFLKILRIL